MYRRTYDGWGYSPLDEIDTSNVASLAPAWTFSTSIERGPSGAADRRTTALSSSPRPAAACWRSTPGAGELLWRFVPELPEDLQQMHPTNRGVALWGDQGVRRDRRRAAHRARRPDGQRWPGRRRWKTTPRGYYMTLAPLAVQGQGDRRRLRRRVGHSRLRRRVRRPDGGRVVEDLHDSRPRRTRPRHLARRHLAHRRRSRSGSPARTTRSSRLTFWGTGNGGPVDGRRAARRQPVLRHPCWRWMSTTGDIRAHHQYHWNDSWDWDEVDPPLLIDVEREWTGLRKALVHPGRNAYLWVLERSADSIRLPGRDPASSTRTCSRSIDPVTGRPEYDPKRRHRVPAPRAVFCPSWSGGKNWPPAAYNPDTKLLYIPANEYTCSYLEGVEEDYRPGPHLHGHGRSLRVARGRGSLRRTAGMEPRHGARRCGRSTSSASSGGRC